jgi:hypothetical protein
MHEQGVCSKNSEPKDESEEECEESDEDFEESEEEYDASEKECEESEEERHASEKSDDTVATVAGTTATDAVVAISADTGNATILSASVLATTDSTSVVAPLRVGDIVVKHAQRLLVRSVGYSTFDGLFWTVDETEDPLVYTHGHWNVLDDLVAVDAAGPLPEAWVRFLEMVRPVHAEHCDDK